MLKKNDQVILDGVEKILNEKISYKKGSLYHIVGRIHKKRKEMDHPAAELSPLSTSAGYQW